MLSGFDASQAEEDELLAYAQEPRTLDPRTLSGLTKRALPTGTKFWRSPLTDNSDSKHAYFPIRVLAGARLGALGSA